MTELSVLTLQKIIDNLSAAIIIVNDNGSIRLYNKAAETLSPSLVQGSTWESAGMLFHTDPSLKQAWMGLLNDKEVLQVELETGIWELESIAVQIESDRFVQITGNQVKKHPLLDSGQSESVELVRARKLLEITRELSYLLEEELVLKKALQLLNESLGADDGLILLTDEVTGEFIVRVELSPDGQPLLTERPAGFWPNQGLAGWVLRTRQAALVSDTRLDKRWIQIGRGKTKTGTLKVQRSALAAPLEFGQEPVGVLMITSLESNQFSADDLELVSRATDLISNALYNSHLYDLVRNQGARLGGMLKQEQVNAAKNQSILESIADGVLVADKTGEMVLANDAFLNIFEIPHWQTVGKHVSTMREIVVDSGALWLTAVQEWASENRTGHAGQTVEDTIVLTTSDRTVRVNLAPVFAGGQFLGTVSTFRDITREIEADLAKTSFISLVSHELRTPLTSVRGYAELMLMGAVGELPDAVLKYVKIIQSNATRLHDLVGDVLLITQFDGGEMPLTIAPSKIDEIINDVVNNHLKNRIKVENREISVFVELSEYLPEVMADRGRVVQILTNLVDNALNYTPDLGEIIVSARSAADFIFISVHDTGIGITVEELDQVFNRFYRSDDINVRKIAGTGLGLSIAQTFVEMHGGRLTVSSEYGVGSIFTFNLPVVQSG
ncbi:MAG: PAS domain S-box-containing protein [Cellvibrionaceae bacterium]